MSGPSPLLTEARLKTSVNELVHAFVLELAMACKKLGIYGTGHPSGRIAVEKPFLVATRVFGFRAYLPLQAFRGQLYVCNIALKESVFSSQILQYMQVLDVTSLVLHREMSIREFTIFAERFVRKLRPDHPDYRLQDYLTRQGITCVDVNSQAGLVWFETQRQYRGDAEDDFSVRRILFDQLGDDPLRLAKLYDLPDRELLQTGIDFDASIVRYLLPEKVATLPPDHLRGAAESLARNIQALPQQTEDRTRLLDQYSSLFKLIELHPARERIVRSLDDAGIHVGPGARSEVQGDTSADRIRNQTAQRMEQLLEEQFAPGAERCETTPFLDSFERLCKTGQQDTAVRTLRRLIDLLHDPQPLYRQRALQLLDAAVEQLTAGPDAPVLEALVLQVSRDLSERRDTFEYSELVRLLFARLHQQYRFDLMAQLTSALGSRRHTDNDVVVYDSIAVKKAFESINRPEIVSSLINELITAEHEKGAALRVTLTNLGSDEVALGLSRIIAHPIRQVRQQSLRILAELGKASLRVFSRILMDDTWFDRDPERHELPDAKWYTVRNSIFVLGSLRDPEGIVPLRLRISDRDIRVRREIVSSLEKIGGEDAIDLLGMMAEDHAREIRETAIAAIGVIGNAETAPMLIDLGRRSPVDLVRIVAVLGKLGGTESASFLTRLLEDDSELTSLAAGRVAKDELRTAVVRALGQIGSSTAIESIKRFQANQSSTQKIFLLNSPLGRVISDILSKK